MPIDLTMPRLSDTMEAGTIIKWTAKEGEEVSAGQSVADIETDKATMEMQVYDDGVLAKILVQEGEQVPVGTLIAVLAEEDEDPAEVAKEAASRAKDAAPAAADAETKDASTASAEGKPAAASPSTSAPVKTEKPGQPGAAEAPRPQPAPAGVGGGAEARDRAPAGGANGRIRVSPVAQRIASEHDLDLRALKGSGPQGRIIKRDVLKAIEEGAPAAEAADSPAAPPAPAPAAPQPLEAKRVPLSNMRQTIAKRLVESKQTIPHYQVTVAVDVGPLLDLRKTLNEQLESQGVKLSVNDFIVRACALSIHHHHEFNAVWGGDHLEIKADVNVGVAVALPPEKGGGLVVATIRHADRKGLRQISHETEALANKARTRGLSLEEMSDSTFTVSNLGMFGVEHFTAIINPPNTAILAVGAAMETPVVRDGEIAIGRLMRITLSLDHRVIDGATAARYLQTLKTMLEHPATLLV